MRRATVSLPHGLSVDGSWVRTAHLRELNGYDEQHLYETIDSSPFTRSISVLERVVSFGDRASSAIRDVLTRLPIGDMTALILQMRKMTFGENLHCLITCPACRVEMSVDLKISQLLEEPLAEPKETYETRVSDFKLSLRPVTCADIEHLKEYSNGSSLAERLVRSCIISSEPLLPAEIENYFLEMIGSRLSELDPQADLVMDLACPGCKHLFQIPFFPEDFLLKEIDAMEPQFEREVHWLAFNYHWGEEAILSLVLRKRKRYVDLINRTLSGESV